MNVFKNDTNGENVLQHNEAKAVETALNTYESNNRSSQHTAIGDSKNSLKELGANACIANIDSRTFSVPENFVVLPPPPPLSSDDDGETSDEADIGNVPVSSTNGK